jgi:CRISPR-associated endonuclease Cas1
MHGLKTIILAGHGLSITSEAIRWLGRENVACYLMNRSAEAVAVIANAPQADARRRALTLRRQQFEAAGEPRRRLEIARKLIRAKLEKLRLFPDDAREFRAELAVARTLEDVLTCEAPAGAAFFMLIRGRKMKFTNEVPAHWPVFVARSGNLLKGKGGTSKARHAATPWGAMLNYAYTVALGQYTRAAIGLGLDPCFGFLHSPKPGRLSLSYDVLELHRADLTRAVFNYVPRNKSERTDFEQDAQGVVRLNAPLARDIAALALRTAPVAQCLKTAKKIASWFYASRYARHIKFCRIQIEKLHCHISAPCSGKFASYHKLNGGLPKTATLDAWKLLSLHLNAQAAMAAGQCL